MKKFAILIFAFFLHVTAVSAAVQVKVTALDEFYTASPAKTIDVKVREDITLGKYALGENSVLHCQVLRIVDPKRGKRNASFYIQPLEYTAGEEKIAIKEEMYGKYSKTVLSKEELKKIPPFKVMKSAALMVGNYFVKGLSIGVSFAEGIIKNEEDNRIKSGVVKAYEDSPLSYIEEGKELEIHAGDDFYFVFKTKDDVEEPNYSYTEPAENN